MPSDSPEFDYDIEALEEYLLSPDLPDEALLLSGLDGYLTAIAVSPQPIPSEEWLPEIWDGAMPPLAVRTETDWVVDAIKAHYAAIRRVLAEQPELLDPIFEQDTDGAPMPETWAEGFMRGVQLRRQDWKPLFETEGWRLLGPIGIFAELPDDRAPPILSEKRREEVRNNAGSLFATCVAGLHGFWEATRRQGAVPPRTGKIIVKVGRNAPCSCGSGRKFKRCCGV
jgi:uncharacterized protein